MTPDFAYIDELVPGIRWDARYATTQNFVGEVVDGYRADRVIGTRAVCEALGAAQELAASDGLGLLLWDAYRPTRAVEHFVQWSQRPEDGSTKWHHYPNITRAEVIEHGYIALKSGHSRGSTVDLTLCDLDTGEAAPMGGDHDLMDILSHHGAAGITAVETANRALLCSIMTSVGFVPYAQEWWHYTLQTEPFPDTYFNFPVA